MLRCTKCVAPPLQVRPLSGGQRHSGVLLFLDVSSLNSAVPSGTALFLLDRDVPKRLENWNRGVDCWAPLLPRQQRIADAAAPGRSITIWICIAGTALWTADHQRQRGLRMPNDHHLALGTASM
jgi:hypothetical protein